MTPLPPLPAMGLSTEQLVLIAKWGHQLAQAEREVALVEAAKWKRLYLRAVNCANGLTNYVVDRPELRSISRALDKIQADASMLRAEAEKSK